MIRLNLARHSRDEGGLLSCILRRISVTRGATTTKYIRSVTAIIVLVSQDNDVLH